MMLVLLTERTTSSFIRLFLNPNNISAFTILIDLRINFDSQDEVD